MPPAWFIEWAESVNLWGILLILGGAITLIWGAVAFVKKGWPWLKAFAKAVINTAQIIDSVKGLPDFIERTDAANADVRATLAGQDKKIAEIHHEVHYNNGSSVKDAVRRVETGVAGLYDEIADLKEADAAIRRDMEDDK